MQAPAQPDPDVAIAMLAVAATPWAHGADATFATVGILHARDVPVAAFEHRVGIAHPMLSQGSAVWTRARGGVWVINVGGQRIVEQRSQREAGGNPLYNDARELRADADPVDALPAGVAERVRDLTQPLDAPIRVALPGWSDACVAGAEYGAPTRSVIVLATDAPDGFTPICAPSTRLRGASARCRAPCVGVRSATLSRACTSALRPVSACWMATCSGAI